VRAPTAVRLPEMMEHRKCSWCYEKSGNAEEETKILLMELYAEKMKDIFSGKTQT